MPDSPTFEEVAFVGLTTPADEAFYRLHISPATFTSLAEAAPCNPPPKQALAQCIIYYMDIPRGVSRLLIVLWVVYGLWLAWGSYNAQGQITKEWIVWSLAVIIVPLLLVYLIAKIVKWIIAGFRIPKHPLQHQP